MTLEGLAEHCMRVLSRHASFAGGCCGVDHPVAGKDHMLPPGMFGTVHVGPDRVLPQSTHEGHDVGIWQALEAQEACQGV